MSTQRYFIRQEVKRTTFRDEKGRFISKEEGIKRGLIPTEVTRTEYRTRSGKFVSEDKVKRSKKKIVDVVRGKDGVLRGKDFKIGGKKIPKPQFNDILGQQMRGKLSEAIASGDRIGFVYKGRFYPVTPEKYGKIQDAWMQLSYAAVKLFKSGDSLYYTIGIAEGPDSLVLDLDSVVPSEVDPDEPEYGRLISDYYDIADEFLKDFLI